jgi:branched-chain amino acid transport system substrate-binding protein
MRAAAIVALCGSLLAGAAVHAQDVVKIGDMEAQTGPNAVNGWMSSQGIPIAVDEINKAGGFEVAGKKYKLQLFSDDNRGDPKEATVQMKRLVEHDKVRFIFGPFLSNVFATILPYAKQFDGKILQMGGATRVHDYLGKPGYDFLIRTWSWDTGPHGFGELMTEYVKKLGTKKVALLLQNDQGGQVVAEIYQGLFKKAGIETRTEMFEPGTKDFTAALAKLASWKPDLLLPGYNDSVMYDIMRQATEGNYIRRFMVVRGSMAPCLKNKNEIDDCIVYVPKYFEDAEKKSEKVRHFIAAYKAYYKRDFPYDQAPICSQSCYDHVYMLVEAMKKAGTVEDVRAIRKAMLSLTYEGLWKISFDEKGEQIFDFDVVHMHRGGKLTVTTIDPPRK